MPEILLTDITSDTSRTLHPEQHNEVNRRVIALEESRGQDDGIATLDGSGHVPDAQLPPTAFTTDSVQVASEVQQLLLNDEVSKGFIAVRTDLGASFIRNAGTDGTMDDWTELPTRPDIVQSVNGGIGEVVLAAADVGAQPADGDLTAIAALTPSDDDVIQRKAGAWVARTPAQLLTDLAIPAPPALDSDLTDIGALTPANDDFLQRKAGVWTNRTPAQALADLGVTGSPFTMNAGNDVIVPADVADSWVVGANQIDRDTGVAGAEDVRAFFNKTNGAFRAGSATGTQWDTAQQGTQSFAAGLNTIASGVRSHAEGSATTASGTASHAEGSSSNASGSSSHAEGSGSTASGLASHAEGEGCIASGQSAHVEGYGSSASGFASHAGGTSAAATRAGQWAHAGAPVQGTFVPAQANLLVLAARTTNATPVVAASTSPDSAAVPTLTGANTNVLTIPVNKAHTFRVTVAARRNDVAGDFAGWRFEGVIGRAAGNAAFAGTVDSRAWSNGAGSAAWDATLTVDTTDATNNYLKLTVTGEAAKTIHWVARMETVEVGS